MKKKTIKNIQKFANKWVAIDEVKREVLASGKSFREVSKKVPANKKYTFFQVPRSDVVYSP